MSITSDTVTEDFKGQIGRTYRDSTPWWPDLKRARPDSPNVLVILFDDLGFGSLGCYGGDADCRWQ